MRILYLQQELILPGARGNARCWEMARRWTQDGHQVTFITTLSGTAENRNTEAGRSTGKHEVFEREGITIHAVDIAFSHMMSFKRRVRSFIEFYFKALKVGKKLSDFDIILAYTSPLTVPALGNKLSKYHRKPFCIEVADVWPDVPIGMGVVKNKLLIGALHNRTNKLYRRASAIFPYTDGMRDQILSHGDFGDKVHLLHNGVDCGRVAFEPREEQPEKVNVLYAGTIGKAYDLSQFVRAVHMIESSGRTDINFTVVGKGNDEELVRAEAERLQVKTLTFKPPVGHEDVPALLATADIGIGCVAPYPVLEHNGATKYFDYLASGLPMVNNYKGWQADYLHEYDCGLTSEMGDEGAFADNILRLVDDSQLRSKFAVNGRRLAEEKFDRRKMAPKYIEVFEQVLASQQL